MVDRCIESLQCVHLNQQLLDSLNLYRIHFCERQRPEYGQRKLTLKSWPIVRTALHAGLFPPWSDGLSNPSPGKWMFRLGMQDLTFKASAMMKLIPVS